MPSPASRSGRVKPLALAALGYHQQLHHIRSPGVDASQSAPSNQEEVHNVTTDKMSHISCSYLQVAPTARATELTGGEEGGQAALLACMPGGMCLRSRAGPGSPWGRSLARTAHVRLRGKRFALVCFTNTLANSLNTIHTTFVHSFQMRPSARTCRFCERY